MVNVDCKSNPMWKQYDLYDKGNRPCMVIPSPPPKLFPFVGICHIIQLVGMSNMQVNLKNASNIIGLHVNDDSLFWHMITITHRQIWGEEGKKSFICIINTYKRQCDRWNSRYMIGHLSCASGQQWNLMAII